MRLNQVYHIRSRKWRQSGAAEAAEGVVAVVALEAAVEAVAGQTIILTRQEARAKTSSQSTRVPNIRICPRDHG